MSVSKIIKISKDFSAELNQLDFSDPVTHVYNPLEYAWRSHKKYLELYAKGKKKTIFLGMNPGPWGMAQTGIPFGEISYVRDWLKIETKVFKPKMENPSRIIEGFDCKRSEVSGQRLWSFLSDEFESAEVFFKNHFILNYCPLVFMEKSGKNRTPDKLPVSESKALFDICDSHLKQIIENLKPEYLIGIGGFAKKRLTKIFGKESEYKIGTVLHPSPASPMANRGWALQAKKQLKEMGLL